ncbi:MAG: M20/M25/M40 family metallo-hydrolase [Thermodesulfobacteriota bacterium]|nr:M20/M25/M40 family metallo-hydrolase [Thermodesulfobacteriota bacterium]
MKRKINAMRYALCAMQLEEFDMDYDQLLNEATQYLQEYIRIETINPPGNEMEGAQFFKKIFDKEFIPCEIFEPSPGRGSLLATLKGSGAKKPILLLSHIDVVPVEKGGWEVDPFEGIIKDGYLYGRGALDNKSMGIVEMMVLFILKRERISLTRDIFFFATADEETGGRWGVQWAMENVPPLKESEYALNEGGYIILNDSGEADRCEISSGQKVIFHLRLKARGRPGHGSMPHPDNPNVKLVNALEGITKWEPPYHVLPMVKEYFSAMAPKQPSYERSFFEDIEKGLSDPSFSIWLTSNPIYNAMLRNTISLTILQGGSKANVIPSESTATLDCRLLPDTSREDFLKEIKRRLGDEIEVEVVAESRSLPPSPLDTDLFQAIHKSAAENDPGCPVIPLLLPGATDSRFLRENGIITYDFCPFRLTEEELVRVHGNNERIALENLRFGMKMMVEILKEIVT